LRADLVDRLAWFRSGGVLGGDGIPAVAAYGVTDPDKMVRFTQISRIALGPDMMEEFERIDAD